MEQRQQQLNDFPEYLRIRQTIDKLRSEEHAIEGRLEEIRIELSKSKRQINGQDAWAVALEAEDQPSMEIDSRSSLREEYQVLEGRARFITEALSTGSLELDRVHGQVSLQICQDARPRFVEQIRRILSGLKEVCEANFELESIRDQLERDGIRTGSLAPAIFDGIGAWDDPYGSRVSHYRKYVADHYIDLEPFKAF